MTVIAIPRGTIVGIEKMLTDENRNNKVSIWKMRMLNTVITNHRDHIKPFHMPKLVIRPSIPIEEKIPAKGRTNNSFVINHNSKSHAPVPNTPRLKSPE